MIRLSVMRLAVILLAGAVLGGGCRTPANGPAGSPANYAAMADSELVLSRDRYEGGASGNLEVVQAQGSRTQSHTAWIEAAAAYQVAVLRLRWIAGDWRGL